MKSASKDFDFFLQKALFSLLSVQFEVKLHIHHKEYKKQHTHVKDWAKTIEDERRTFKTTTTTTNAVLQMQKGSSR